MLTPCQRNCKVAAGSCSTCKRTLTEIMEWKEMANEKRMEIMKELKWRGNTHSCPSCTNPTYCAMLDGKSGSACWCMGEVVPNNTTLAATEGSLCLCKKCLQDA